MAWLQRLDRTQRERAARGPVGGRCTQAALGVSFGSASATPRPTLSPAPTICPGHLGAGEALHLTQDIPHACSLAPRVVPDALLLALSLAAGGCGGTEPEVPAAASLDLASVSLASLGQTTQLAATVTDQKGDRIASPALTWTSSNGAVASVSSTGLVTAAGNGSATITVAAGSATAQADVTVSQMPADMQKVAGDGQTTAPGRAVAVPITVQVNDAGGSPIAGLGVSFSAAAGTLGSSSASTGADGRASTAFTPNASGDQQVVASIAGTALSVTFTATGVSPFRIELQFLTSVTPAQMQAFTAAKQRWEGIIVGDVANLPNFSAAAGSCGANSPSIRRPVDDLLILVTLQPIDGAGNILGGAAPCFVRSIGKLTVMGLMQFDTDDLDLLETNNLLQTVITHEMGHVLGYGTIWPDLGLLAGGGGADPHFTGAQALSGFNLAGGTAYHGGLKVPVENTGGPGTADAHWRESVFGSELMTGFVQLGVNPLSEVTVGSMADLGYVVNVAAADPYELVPALLVFGRARRVALPNDILRIPRREVDEGGRVMHVVQP